MQIITCNDLYIHITVCTTILWRTESPNTSQGAAFVHVRVHMRKDVFDVVQPRLRTVQLVPLRTSRLEEYSGASH